MSFRQSLINCLVQCDKVSHTVADESKNVTECTSTTTTDRTEQIGVTHQGLVSTKPTTNMTAVSRTTASPPGESNETSLFGA